MPSFSLPSGGSGTRVADLLDKLVAIHVTDVEDGEAQGVVKPRAIGGVYELSLEARTVEPLGEIYFFQDILVPELRKVGVDGWLVTRIVQPGRAYLFEPPTEQKIPPITRLMDRLGDEGPDATGPEPDDGFDDDLDDDLPIIDDQTF